MISRNYYEGGVVAQSFCTEAMDDLLDSHGKFAVRPNAGCEKLNEI